MFKCCHINICFNISFIKCLCDNLWPLSCEFSLLKDFFYVQAREILTFLSRQWIYLWLRIMKNVTVTSGLSIMVLHKKYMKNNSDDLHLIYTECLYRSTIHLTGNAFTKIWLRLTLIAYLYMQKVYYTSLYKEKRIA